MKPDLEKLQKRRYFQYILPAIILVAAIVMPSALALYWVIGIIFVIVQSYFMLIRDKGMVVVK